jgi:hypothetical protein
VKWEEGNIILKVPENNFCRVKKSETKQKIKWLLFPEMSRGLYCYIKKLFPYAGKER